MSTGLDGTVPAGADIAETLKAAVPPKFGISIAVGEVPHNLPNNPGPLPWIQVADGQALVRFPDGRRILVSDGQEILLHLPQASTPSAQQSTTDTWMIDTWAVPIAMMQRGMLTLHASTVAIDGSNVAIGGASGTGKSTTSWALNARGHDFMVDETTICELSTQGVLIHPFHRRVNLTHDALTRLRPPEAEMHQVAASPGKFAFMPPPPKSNSAELLHRIVVLSVGDPGSHVSVEPLTGPAALPILSTIAERRGLATAILGRRRYLDSMAAIAESVPVFRLQRPYGFWSLDDVLEGVEDLAR